MNRLPRYQIGDDFYWSSKQVTEATGLTYKQIERLRSLGFASRVMWRHRSLYPTTQVIGLWRAYMGLQMPSMPVSDTYIVEGVVVIDNGERGTWWKKYDHSYKPKEDIAGMLMHVDSIGTPLGQLPERARQHLKVVELLSSAKPALRLEGVDYYTTAQTMEISGLSRQFLDNAVKRGHHLPMKKYQKRWYRRGDIMGLVGLSRSREIRRRPVIGQKSKANPEDFYLATLATCDTEFDYNKELTYDRPANQTA